MDNQIDGGSRHIEIDQINGLIEAAGADGAREILDAFWRTSEELLDLMASQMTDGALELAANTAHSLKGMAANVGASALAAAANDLEIACQKKDATAATGHLQGTRTQYEAARSSLLDHLSQADTKLADTKLAGTK